MIDVRRPARSRSSEGGASASLPVAGRARHLRRRWAVCGAALAVGAAVVTSGIALLTAEGTVRVDMPTPAATSPTVPTSVAPAPTSSVACGVDPRAPQIGDHVVEVTVTSRWAGTGVQRDVVLPGELLASNGCPR